MIVLDTTVLVYAVGGDHPLAPRCRRLVEAIGEGRVNATTTAEAIQEFVHVRARRRTRQDAADLGLRYTELLSPLLAVDADALARGLRLFARHPVLGAFDAVLAAAALEARAEALVSADRSFGVVRGLPWVDPAGPGLERLLAGRG
ncbi:MAG TPA: type II toxin-antitoxin system VapC family toxin [Actinomycetota bacterium]|nr:type II toxin-antitoxin system VapC family toxin [Actinomycetota bacterium]